MEMKVYIQFLVTKAMVRANRKRKKKTLRIFNYSLKFQRSVIFAFYSDITFIIGLLLDKYLTHYSAVSLIIKFLYINHYLNSYHKRSM